MKHLLAPCVLAAFLAASSLGCATSSKEEQQKALTHQQKSDEAAAIGNYGVAGDEQRKAADAHHEAVKKAIDEGKPIPDQTKAGDTPTPLEKK